MTVERLRTYLTEMQQVTKDSLDFVHGVSKEVFLQDLILQRAIGMNLLMIGELTTRIMDEYPGFVIDFPDIPWQRMRGMRNLIAHGYMNINLDTVWDTVHSAIPELLDKLNGLVNWHAQGE